MADSNKKIKLLFNLLNVTGFSALTFFSVSFITVLFQINSPLHRQTDYSFYIGFPYTYYYQGMHGLEHPHSGWYVMNLIWDIFITWLFIIVFYIIFKRKK
jgi:hypothetical protein